MRTKSLEGIENQSSYLIILIIKSQDRNAKSNGWSLVRQFLKERYSYSCNQFTVGA